MAGDVVQFHTRLVRYTHSVMIIGVRDKKITYAGHTSCRVACLNDVLVESLKNRIQYDKVRIIHIKNYTS